MDSLYGGFLNLHKLVPAGETYEVSGIVIGYKHWIQLASYINDNGTYGNANNVIYTAYGIEN